MALRFLTLLLTLTLVTVLSVAPIANAMAHGPAAVATDPTGGHGHLHFDDDPAGTKIAVPHNAADHEHSPYVVPATTDASVQRIEGRIEVRATALRSGWPPESDPRPPRA